MTDNTEKPLTLSREDLYELAWSKPINQLAKDFGISDVALAKRCRRLRIPLPGRGYWARLVAGQTPYRPKLPKREPQWYDKSALTVAPSAGAYAAAILSSEETLKSADPESVPARIASLVISPTTSMLEALPAVKRTALWEKHPQRAELKFERGERTGVVFDLEVTPPALDRALLLADTLLRASSALGWLFDVPELPPEKQGTPGLKTEANSAQGDSKEAPKRDCGRLLVEGEAVALRIEERFREEPVEPTAAQLAREKREYGYHAPRKVSVATGALRVVRLDTYRKYGAPDRRSWYDRPGRRVEEQMPEILLGIHELALSIKERREKDERAARQRAELARRHQEEEAIRDANQKLITQLEADTGAWYRARYLRRYIRAARRTLGADSLPADFRGQAIDYLDWAERYVDQLDPLQMSLRSGEFEERATYHFQNDLDRMKKTFGRLLGADWSKAFKLGNDYSPKPKSDGSWPYREKSVFEVGPANGEGDD